MNWEKLHQTSIVADMHCHSAIKKTIFNRDLKSSKTKFLASFFKEKFWPFSNRATFPKIMNGGLDIMLSTAYIPEGGWYTDCLLYTSPSPRDVEESRMPSSA